MASNHCSKVRILHEARKKLRSVAQRQRHNDESVDSEGSTPFRPTMVSVV